MSHLADICRSRFRKASAGQASPALATLRQHSAELTWIYSHTEHAAVRTVARHIWNNRTKVMTSGIWLYLSQRTTFACKIMIEMGHSAKLTSGIWIDLLQCTTFACGTQISWKIFLHQFKRKICKHGTHLSGKYHHCRTVRSRLNVKCCPETLLTPICARLLSLYLWENTVSWFVA